jgi:hypothetical protein
MGPIYIGRGVNEHIRIIDDKCEHKKVSIKSEHRVNEHTDVESKIYPNLSPQCLPKYN